MSLVADYAASDDDSRTHPPGTQGPPDAPPGGPANAPPAKRRKRLSLQSLVKSAAAVSAMAAGPPAGTQRTPSVPSAATPRIPAPQFSPEAVAEEMDAEFQREDEEREKADLLSEFLSHVSEAPEPPPEEPKNPEREAMLQALFDAPNERGSEPLPLKLAPKPKAKGKETIWQQEARKQRLDQATYTLKPNRDCPDLWQGGGRGKPSETMKERTHRKLKHGQSEWRTETPHGAWKTEEEMQLRNFYDC